MMRIAAVVLLCALASPVLAQDSGDAALGGKIVTLLWLVLYVALATAVHLFSMAVAGIGLKDTPERISVGIGPMVLERSVQGVPVQFKMLPVSGSVKFASLGMLARFLVPAVGLGMLMLIAILLGKQAFANAHFVATLTALWQGIVSLDMSGAVGALMEIVARYPIAKGIAAVFAGVSALNALPLMTLGGGQVLWGIIGAWTKTTPTDWKVMEKVVIAEVVILLAVLALFLTALAAWLFG